MAQQHEGLINRMIEDAEAGAMSDDPADKERLATLESV